MKAAAVRAFGEPLAIEDRPDPEPGLGQERIRVEASGLCHADIHAAHGDWPIEPNPSFMPGHGGIRLAEASGDGASILSVGQRVAVPWLGRACGRCELHTAGRSKVIHGTYPPASVNEPIDAVLRHGDIKARMVFDLGTGR